MNDAPPGPLDAAAQVLDALRARGAAAREALALARLDAVVRRGRAQDAAVQHWLAPRLAEALAALQARVDARVDAPLAAADGVHAGPDAAGAASPRTPLSALAGLPAAELRTVQRLRPTLARLRVQRQIARAQARQPDNPGPLNSEHLLVRALQQMQALAPAYLGPFITQVETLLWLDGAKGVVGAVGAVGAAGAGGGAGTAAAPVRDRPAARRR